MGAQMMHGVNEILFTDADETVLITLADGRVLEFFGDGVVQYRVQDEEAASHAMIQRVETV